ncbi:T9SS type A sorting domain-containing protein [Flavitalea sp. BT771]|uniref:T9SS type A sorting domain-containing protein n=1 Tax=Flavitalea sp. BT771 TaxID=3063329 RepID=UPI0026E15959|nr:T9SS type A sorting domain-containing protein [Flavitalea sp. BT771]MDO6433400.1 T9SS type A sorting domain-containing protein [Flavitalea sp. BT771]MDV6222695.1 T9SS type A sorting domain-containing protein [Flavitalea sp. BT771]
MKKIFWFTVVAFCCCITVRSQQPAAPMDPSDSSIKKITVESNGKVFTNFTATIRDINKVWLQWEVDSAADGDYFIVERATDGQHFETIGALRKTGNNNHYELTDMAPPNGTDHYRVRYTGQSETQYYTKAVQLSLSGDVTFKFYPNPVDKLFIIRTEHSVDIQVMDAAGSIRFTQRLQPGIQVINASSLERGVYILRVADKESNRVVSNQLIKN